MTIATPVKAPTAIAIGLGKLYFGDSITHIAEFNKILSNLAYIGAVADISFLADKKILEMESGRRGFKEIMKRIISKAQVSLNCNILELTTKNMSYSFGGDGGLGNILNDLFGEPSILRAELVFLYPDKVTQMIIILPSVQVISNPSLGFNAEEAMASSITLSPLSTGEVVWANDPMGRVYWV